MFENEDKANDLVYECISKTVESMAAYTKKEHTSVVWKCFYVSKKKIFKELSKHFVICFFFFVKGSHR
jgi:hypothetical protein